MSAHRLPTSVSFARLGLHSTSPRLTRRVTSCGRSFDKWAPLLAIRSSVSRSSLDKGSTCPGLMEASFMAGTIEHDADSGNTYCLPSSASFARRHHLASP